MIWALANWKSLLGVLIGIALIGWGWTMRGWHDDAALKHAADAALAERIESERKSAEIDRLTSIKLETDREAGETLNTEAEHETAKADPGYRCRLPVDGLRLYRRALAAAAR